MNGRSTIFRIPMHQVGAMTLVQTNVKLPKMWIIPRLITTLAVLISMQLINGETLFDVFQLKTPSSYYLRNKLVDWITTYPGVDVLGFNEKETTLVIPKTYLQQFWKFAVLKNKTDILERKLLTNSIAAIDSKKKNKYTTIVPDNGVRKLMESEKGHLHINFNEMPSYQQITAFLLSLSSRFPKNIKLEKLAKTVKNQQIYLVTIFARKIKSRNGVFLHAGVQGREWPSVLVSLYLIQELMENSHSYPEILHLSWYIIPVVNPDGYRHVYKHPQTTVWHRKNRNCLKPCEYGECGVNIFKNFPWKFQGQGSSKEPCSSFYPGKKAFSEIESKALAKALSEHKDYIKLYIGIHGYDRAILYPWGHKGNKEMKQLAKIAAQAINAESVNLTHYSVGYLGTATFSSAGNPLTYVKHHLGIKYAFLIHMRASRDKHIKLQFPLNEVLPAVKEIFTGIKAMAAVIYTKNLPPKESLRKSDRKRKLVDLESSGAKVKTISALFTWYLITTFVR